MKKCSLISILCGLLVSVTIQANDLWKYDLQAEINKPLQSLFIYEDFYFLGNKSYPYMLIKGEYKVSGSYKPTFWLKNEENLEQENLMTMLDENYNEESSKFANVYINTEVEFSDFSIMSIDLPLGIMPLIGYK